MVHSGPAQVSLLHSVFGIGDATEDAVGHRDEQAAMLVEYIGRVKPALACHNLAQLSSSSHVRVLRFPIPIRRTTHLVSRHHKDHAVRGGRLASSTPDSGR